MKILREFGLGIVWFLLVPLILLACGLIAVYGVFNFLIQFVVMVVNFFKGEKLFPLFPEEKKAMAIYQKAIDKANGESTEEKPAAPQTVYVQQNFYSGAPMMPGVPPMPGLPNNPYYNQGTMPGATLPNYQPAPQPAAIPNPETPQIPNPQMAQIPNPVINQIPAQPTPEVVEVKPLDLAQFPSDKEANK